MMFRNVVVYLILVLLVGVAGMALNTAPEPRVLTLVGENIMHVDEQAFLPPKAEGRVWVTLDDDVALVSNRENVVSVYQISRGTSVCAVTPRHLELLEELSHFGPYANEARDAAMAAIRAKIAQEEFDCITLVVRPAKS